MITKDEIKIGLKFIPISGKRKDKKIHTIEDIHTTYNSKNELVKTRFVVSYDYIGQRLTNYDTCIVTIQRAEKV
jgi:hypothetical protein